MKLINLEICTINRDDCLFKFFIPSLDKIKHLSDICCITINYNGSIPSEKIEEANELIRQKGFELYWAYNHYMFMPRRHKILKVRNDCDKLGPKTKYILLGDDDLEFLDGYDRQLLAAVNLLEHDDSVGIVSLREQAKDRQVVDTLMPASPEYFFVLCGGLLIRRMPSWDGLYPAEILELHGGGEERVIGCELFREGYKGYYLHTDAYAHEQRWKDATFICGQSIFKWSWNSKDPTTVMSRIESYRDRTKAKNNYGLAWTYPDIYWLNPENEICFADKTTEELYNEVLASVSAREQAQAEAAVEPIEEPTTPVEQE